MGASTEPDQESDEPPDQTGADEASEPARPDDPQGTDSPDQGPRGESQSVDSHQPARPLPSSEPEHFATQPERGTTPASDHGSEPDQQ